MTANIKKTGVLTVLTVIILIGFVAQKAQAQTITSEDIAGQEQVVMIKMFETIEEQLKLVQMVYIQNLQQRVAELEELATGVK